MPIDSGPSGSTTTTTVTQPWSEQQGPLKFGFGQARQIYDSTNPSYYPGSTVAGPTEAQLMGNEAQIGRAMNGSPVNDAAKSNIEGTLSGQYLSEGNPYLEAMIDKSMKRVRPMVNDAFGNNYGSSAHQGAMSSSLMDAATDLYYQNYNDERSRQMQALGLAPSISNMDYTDIAALQDAGKWQQDEQQKGINADIQKWNYNQNLQQNKLADYMRMIQGNYGSSSTQTQPYYDNTLGGILGAILGIGATAAKFSDRRMKENVQRIGTADNGLAIYRFNYIGDPRPEIGVMAQDVAEMNPEAVIDFHGLLMVDLDRVFPRVN